MASFCSVTLVGNVGKDPVITETGKGTKLAKFSVAVSSGYGERKTTTWWNCTAFGRQAEQVARFVTKGQSVGVSGRAELRSYTTKAGKEGSSLDVSADSVTFLSPKTAENGIRQPGSEPMGEEVPPTDESAEAF